MSRPVQQSAERAAVRGPLARIELNSVSTRIIALVLIATILTAAMVSALCIRAIHADLAQRVAADFRSIADAAALRFESESTTLRDQLRVASRPGSEWQAELAGLAHDSSSFLWTAIPAPDSSAPEAGSLVAGMLPAPPSELALAFDRLSFVRPGDSPPRAAPCASLELTNEVTDVSGRALGRLSGCVTRDRLNAWLASPAGGRSSRTLLVHLRGSVLDAVGEGAASRRRESIPIGELVARKGTTLAHYSDPAGRALVGLALPLELQGLLVVVESEHARAFEPALALTRSIFILDVCVILLFGLLAHRITVAIMEPIHALSSGAQRILEGHIDHQIPAPAIHDDELGLLTHTFNEMMRKLRHNQVEIERDRIRLAEKNDELQSANEVLSQLSITDGLTKLHNHRYFQDNLTREIKRVSRTHAPLSLILIDIDDFKQLNDTYGHAAGDDVLTSLAAIMNESARESDLIARYGGEEFVILMPNTDLAGAVHLAEKIRMAVESRRLIIGDRMKPVLVTISLGVALYKGNRREFFAEADRALYRAKAAGKNCVIIAGSEGTPLD